MINNNKLNKNCKQKILTELRHLEAPGLTATCNNTDTIYKLHILKSRDLRVANTVFDVKTRETFQSLNLLHASQPFQDVVGFPVITEISLAVTDWVR